MPLPPGLAGQFDGDGAVAGLLASKPNGVPTLAPEQPVSDTIAAAISNKFSRILGNSFVVRCAPAGPGFGLLRQMIVAKAEELVLCWMSCTHRASGATPGTVLTEFLGLSS